MNYRTERRPYRELDDDERHYATAPVDGIRRELEHHGVRVEPAIAAVRALIDQRTPRVRAASALDPETTYLLHLESIEKIAAFVARRGHLSAGEIGAFVQVARVRLFENDYEIIRKFEGRSSFSTYLTTVILRLFHAWRAGERGKWRPSAQAKALGENVLADLPSESPAAVERVRAGQREIALRAAAAGLDRAISDFNPEDRLVLQLRFSHERTVPDIARILGREPKKVYRHLARLFKALRQALEEAGIDPAAVGELMDRPVLDLALEPQAERTVDGHTRGDERILRRQQ